MHERWVGGARGWWQVQPLLPSTKRGSAGRAEASGPHGMILSAILTEVVTSEAKEVVGEAIEVMTLTLTA